MKRPLASMALSLLAVTISLSATLQAAPKKAPPAPSAADIKKVEAALPKTAPAKPIKARKILVFSLCKAYYHRVIPLAKIAFEKLGKKTGAYKVVLSDDPAAFTTENLKNFDAILFNNPTATPLTEPQRKAILDFVKKDGKGIIGTHAATDNFKDWPEGVEMMGALFMNHPWRSNGTWAVKLDKPNHTLNKSFGGKGFKINDEIYAFRAESYDPKKLNVLLSLDFSDAKTLQPLKNRKDARPNKDYAISWTRDFGKGRVFYCSLGHNNNVLQNPAIMQHYLAGIQYALGDLKISDAPGPFESIVTYQYGQPREKLMAIENAIRAAGKDPAALKAIEKKLLVDLQNPKTSRDGCVWLCRQLRIIGTEESVAPLATLLTDKERSHMACFAMQDMASPAASQALLAALDKTSGDVEIGILSTLGARREDKAIPAITKRLKDAKTSLAMKQAAINALGQIGTTESANALQAMKPCDACQAIWTEALLRCAQHLQRGIGARQAVGIYAKLYEDGRPVVTRAAGLRGLAQLNATKATPLVIKALSSKEFALRRVAIQLVATLPGKEATLRFAATLPKLESASQILLLDALATRGDQAAAPAVRTATKSKDPKVQLAAIRALGLLGNTDDVKTMLQWAGSEKGDLANAGTDALVILPAKGVDKLLISMLSPETSKAKQSEKLLTILTRRGAQSAVPVALKFLKEGILSGAATDALSKLAGEPQAPPLAELFAATNNAKTQASVIKIFAGVCKRTRKPDPLADAILTQAGKSPNVSRKMILTAMGRLRGEKALAELKKSLASKDDAEVKQSVKALSSWDNSKPVADLLATAKATKGPTHILALRGAIDLVGHDRDRRNKTKNVALLKQAMEIATRPDEKKQALGILGKFPCKEALTLAETALTDKALETEAKNVIKRIKKDLKIK